MSDLATVCLRGAEIRRAANALWDTLIRQNFQSPVENLGQNCSHLMLKILTVWA